MEDITKGKPFKKELQVKLTTVERLDYADQLSRMFQDLVSLNDAKSETAKDYAARIKATEASLGNVSRVLSNGYEYRPVECYWEYDWTHGNKYLFRTDGGEPNPIKVEIITLEERQQQLGLEAKQNPPDPAPQSVTINVNLPGPIPQPEHHTIDAEILPEAKDALPENTDHDEHCLECGYAHVLHGKFKGCTLADDQACQCTVCYPKEQRAPIEA